MAHTIMLLHGLPGCGDQWKTVSECLAQYEVVRPTFGGFAGSDAGSRFPSTQDHAQEIVSWAISLKADSLTVVAWSFSCHPLLYALCHLDFAPARVVLVEPSSDSYLAADEAVAFGQDAANAFGPLFPALQQDDDCGLVRTLFCASGTSGDWTGLTSEERAPFLASATALRAAFDGSAKPADISMSDIQNISVETHVFMGSATRPMFRLASQRVARAIAGASLHVIDGVNHLWPVSDPKAFARRIERLLGKAS